MSLKILHTADNHIGLSFAKYPDVKKYRDYRKLLDEMDRQVDAVVVSTPNHIHVAASVTAVNAKKINGKRHRCQ